MNSYAINDIRIAKIVVIIELNKYASFTSFLLKPIDCNNPIEWTLLIIEEILKYNRL